MVISDVGEGDEGGGNRFSDEPFRDQEILDAVGVALDGIEKAR